MMNTFLILKCLNLVGILSRIGMLLCLKAHKENSDLSLDYWVLRIVNFKSPYLLLEPLDELYFCDTMHVDVMYFQLKF